MDWHLYCRIILSIETWRLKSYQLNVHLRIGYGLIYMGGLIGYRKIIGKRKAVCDLCTQYAFRTTMPSTGTGYIKGSSLSQEVEWVFLDLAKHFVILCVLSMLVLFLIVVLMGKAAHLNSKVAFVSHEWLWDGMNWSFLGHSLELDDHFYYSYLFLFSRMSLQLDWSFPWKAH